MTPIERLRFRADASALPGTIELSWDLLQSNESDDATSVIVVRRERRFPGKSRRGFLPVVAFPEDLADGVTVYITTSFQFDFEEKWEELEDDVHVSTTRQYVFQGEPRDRVLARVVRREIAASDNAPRRTRLRFFDRQALVAGRIYYYTCFLADGGDVRYSRSTQGSALAAQGGQHRIFVALPQVQRQYDTNYPNLNTVANADRLKGQLERLLSVVEAHADLYRSAIAGLQDLHSVRRADSRVLPRIAQQVNWKLTDYLDEDGQRTELAFAVEAYRSTGTTTNVAAAVKRLSRWRVRFREFAANVLRSFDPTRLEKLESAATVYLDGGAVQSGLPRGSVDTRDSDAMTKLRTKPVDDPSVYTYDTRVADPIGDSTGGAGLYNLTTLGIYVSAESGVDQTRLSQDGPKLLSALAGFLPIQIRPSLMLSPPDASPH